MKHFSKLAFLPFVLLVALAGYAQPSQNNSEYLNLDGDSLYYEVSGDGFPLVLVSGGSGMDIYQWSLVAPELEKSYKVVQVDPRGVGRSDNPTVHYSDAADLERLFDHLGLDRLVIIGLSSGGGLVLEYALRYPDRLAGVVAAAPFVPGFDFSDEMRARLDVFSMAADEGREPFLDSMFDDAHFMPAPLDRSIRTQARSNMAENYDKGADFDPRLVSPLDPPLIERLGQIKATVLLVLGGQDHQEVFRRNQFYLETIPLASEKVVESAGHNIPLENPAGFLEAIETFLVDLARK